MDQLLKSKYRIGQKLSENPFSVTYRGFFLGTEKPVIVKIYKRGGLNSSLVKSMKQRVAGFSLINHHGIARLFDGDYGWQGFYYVREFVEGKSLQEIIDSGEKPEPEKAVAIADQTLDALAAAHARNIIHGALKPGNIFIDSQGLVRLTDFVIEGEIKGSMPQKALEMMENARYAPPEELEGKPLTPASDLFSFGLIFFELLAGKSKLLEDGLRGGINKLRSNVILTREALAPLPNYLREILLMVLQKDPLRRLASAAELRAALEQKNLPERVSGSAALTRIFENTVTQYGGEEISIESEALEDVGKVRLRWSREKHRNWILAVVLAAAVTLGILYAFFWGW